MLLLRFKAFLQTSHHLSIITKTYTTNVRVRFAPSPTGQLHLGGLRTALYNYLYAKSHSGKLIMRVEDTDQTRLVQGSATKIEEMLNWAGIEFDEGPRKGGPCGPYVQSERKWIYWEKIQELLKNGTAYHCFCSPKRLQLLRKEALRQGETPRYDNRCRCLKQKEVDDYLREGTPYTIRLRLEPYTDPWHDMVYGPIICDIASYEGDPGAIWNAKEDRLKYVHVLLAGGADVNIRDRSLHNSLLNLIHRTRSTNQEMTREEMEVAELLVVAGYQVLFSLMAELSYIN